VAILGIAAEGGERREIAARTHADLEPVIAQQVEHDGVLGHAHR
jgi:hypothetical protein